MVEGKVEELQPCPCCSFRTLKERGHICPLCLWDDCGDDLNKYSGPNHMTLLEGRTRFANHNGRIFGNHKLSQSSSEIAEFNDMKKRYYR